MRKAALLIIVVLCCASVAFAQLPGSVAPFADAAGTSCQMADAPGIGYVYMYHNYTTGATASEFKVVLPACVIWLADNSTFPLKSGNFKDGTSIPYQSCLLGPVNLGFMLLSMTGACPPCTYVSVIENPNSLPPPNPGDVYVVDCTPGDPQLMVATGGEMIINPNPTCECDVPVEDTTWGQVKALFE
jgi:hypothetical protein